MIKPGRMREVITIETPAPSGPVGQSVWSPFATGVRAELVPLSGRELAAPNIGGSETTHKFIIRPVDGVRADMRISVASLPDRFYLVTHTLPQFGNREVWVFAKEVMTR